MPRPKGYVVSEEERSKLSSAMKRVWSERRKPWAEIMRPIQEAMDQGDRELAHDLIDSVMDSWEEGDDE